jgi:UDP-3-O-[3-hydroxymyristoyl] glucosamine N-acyltransferase
MSQESYTLKALANITGATLQGDPNRKIHGIASLAQAKSGELSFVADETYLSQLASSEATAVIIPADCANACHTDALVVPNAKLAFIKVAQLFHPVSSPSPGCHPTAVVGEHSTIHPSAYVGPHVVLGDHVTIGADVVLGPGTSVGDHVSIGAGSVFHSNVTVYPHCVIGERAVIHSGVVIGADGFGFTPNAAKHWVKVPQVGRVVIGHDVEIGANTTIDRGALDDTTLGDGVKIDNLVMIGHNVTVGQHTLICGCTGIAGSTAIGQHCTIGGASTINGHIRIADHVVLAGASGVMKSIAEAGAYGSAMLLQPIREWKKSLLRYWKLGDLFHRVRKLELSQGKQHDNDQ